MKFTIRYVFFAFVLLVSSQKVIARNTIKITSEKSDILVTSEFVDLFVDSSSSLSFPQIVSGRGVLTASENLFCEDPDLTYWLKFKIEGSKQTREKRVLEILDSRLGEVTFFNPRSSGVYDSLTLGRSHSFKKRNYRHKNIVFDFYPSSDASQLYYIRIRPGLIGSMIFKIRTNQDFTSYAVSEYYLLGIYYGILFIISVYNLFLFMLIRERIYLYYVLYALVWAFLSMLDDGTGAQYYWAGSNWVNEFGYLIARPLLIFLFVMYSKIFLDLATHHRKIEKVLYLSAFIYFVYHLIKHYVPFDFLGSVLFITPFVVVYVVAIQRYRQGYQPAKFFLVGNTFVLIGILIRLFKDAGLINYLTDSGLIQTASIYSRDIGMVIEIVVLSIALGARIRFLKSEEAAAKDEAYNQLQEKEAMAQRINIELEDKVAQRTVELKKQQDELQQLNGKLKEQASEINQMNLALDLDNRKLTEDVKRVNEARIQSEKVSLVEFKQIYPDELAVLRYLAQIKWKYAYSCTKCGNEKYCEGSKKFSRRCTKCRYDESVTTYTLFHKCKFSLVHALYITMKVNQSESEVSALELSKELDMRKSTVWGFKQKVLEVIERLKKTNKNYSEENRLNRVILKID